MEADIAAVVAATLFGSAAVVAAVGFVFVGFRAIRLFSQAQTRLRDSVERLEAEIDEVQERLDSHERALRHQSDAPKIEGDV